MWIKLFNDGGPKVSYCGIFSYGEAFLCPCAQAVISLNLMSVKNDQLSACVVCPPLCQALSLVHYFQQPLKYTYLGSTISTKME